MISIIKIKLQNKKQKEKMLHLSPGSPLAATSLCESSTMILSSLDLCTSMLCTADVSAATTAKPSPTKPKMDSIALFLICLVFEFRSVSLSAFLIALELGHTVCAFGVRKLEVIAGDLRNKFTQRVCLVVCNLLVHIQNNIYLQPVLLSQ